MTNPTATLPDELSCEKCRDLLSEHTDGELPPEVLVTIDHHLKTCQKCASESTRIHGLKNLVNHWEGIEGNDRWRTSVMNQFIRESSMMPSEPFVEAADKAKAKAESERELAEAEQGLSPIWVLSIAFFLAVAAYFLVQFFS